MFAVPDHTIGTAGPAALGHPVRIALAYAADRARLAGLLRYDPDERFATRIDHPGDDEVWLLSWLPGQHAARHDHGDTSGAFTVVSGTLTEVVHRRSAVDATTDDRHAVADGQSRVFGPGYVHTIGNDGPDPAVSIHVYRDGPRTVRTR